MASLKDWCGKLKECGIFEALRRGTSKLPTVNEAKNYIAIRNNELFLWNCCDSTLLRLRLMRLAASEPSGEDAKRPVYQVRFHSHLLFVIIRPLYQLHFVCFRFSITYL